MPRVLIAYADLVVSAGGTMNREAVALGTPVYTTFAGRMGGVDEALIADGSLEASESAEQLELVKRQRPGLKNPRDPDFLVRECSKPRLGRNGTWVEVIRSMCGITSTQKPLVGRIATSRPAS